jgi:hypothetical protein
MRSRLLATLLALPAAFAIPGLAVAHGLDHAAISEHASHHSDEAGVPSTARDAEVSAAADASSHEDDHQHPTLGAGVRGKHDVTVLAATSRAIALPLAVSDGDPRIPFAHHRIKAHGAHAPPPNLRGPPGIGD